MAFWGKLSWKVFTFWGRTMMGSELRLRLGSSSSVGWKGWTIGLALQVVGGVVVVVVLIAPCWHERSHQRGEGQRERAYIFLIVAQAKDQTLCPCLAPLSVSLLSQGGFSFFLCVLLFCFYHLFYLTLWMKLIFIHFWIKKSNKILIYKLPVKRQVIRQKQKTKRISKGSCKLLPKWSTLLMA